MSPTPITCVFAHTVIEQPRTSPFEVLLVPLELLWYHICCCFILSSIWGWLYSSNVESSSRSKCSFFNLVISRRNSTYRWQRLRASLLFVNCRSLWCGYIESESTDIGSTRPDLQESPFTKRTEFHTHLLLVTSNQNRRLHTLAFIRSSYAWSQSFRLKFDV